jgi:putative endonuclease
MRDRRYYVYILTNARNTVLYTGVTSDIGRRLEEHRSKTTPGFTNRYHVDKLVHVEVFDSIENAILREKQIRAGSRKKKAAMIERDNATWSDLAHLL